MKTTNNSKDFKSYLIKFRKFHENFYKKIRNFLIVRENPPSSNGGNNEGISIRQKLYKELLTKDVERFCSDIVAKFLHEYHSVEFIKDSTNGLPFRGLVYLHSREFGEGKKIDIPFGDWYSKNESKVTKEVFDKRHAVVHILGETIWRFGPENKIIPCIHFSSDANSILEEYDYSVSVPLIEAKIINGALKEKIKKLKIKNKKWENDLYDILNKEGVFKNIENIITRAKDNFQKWIPPYPMFLIEGTRTKYYRKEIKMLLANPIRHAIINGASNIFYIPDIHRGAITGGLVCELSLKGIPSKKKLLEILSDLHWIFSNYVFSALSSCENEFGSGSGFTYSDKFYTRKSIFKKFKNSLQDKIENFGFKSALEPIKYFFESVSEERGQCVRGYDEIAKKAFITACKLWNSLKVYKYSVDFGVTLEATKLVNLETAVTKFKEVSNEQPALNLLWIALDFEGTLKNIPSYREHFLHSFHIFCLGLWIILNEDFPYYKKLRADVNFLRKWYLASFWHDVPYAMQKLDHISNVFIKRLITYGYKRKEKGLLVPISPSWGHLLLARDFYKLLLGEVIFKEELKKTLTVSEGFFIKEDFSEIILEKMLEKAEHGILSGLILYHQICNNKDSEKLRKKLIPVIVAIILHGCYDWRWKEKETEKEKEGYKMLKIDIEKAPIAHLLMLCDSLVQCGREFTDDDAKSETEIKFGGISEGKDVIRIMLKYYDRTIGNMEQIKKNYFKPVLDVLVLNSKDRKDQPQIKCKIQENEKHDNTKKILYNLGSLKR